jgi:hypothetical protein
MQEPTVKNADEKDQSAHRTCSGYSVRFISTIEFQNQHPNARVKANGKGP